MHSQAFSQLTDEKGEKVWVNGKRVISGSLTAIFFLATNFRHFVENICAKFSSPKILCLKKIRQKSLKIATTAYNDKWVLVSSLFLYFWVSPNLG
jgi:hypothetical protein